MRTYDLDSRLRKAILDMLVQRGINARLFICGAGVGIQLIGHLKSSRLVCRTKGAGASMIFSVRFAASSSAACMVRQGTSYPDDITGCISDPDPVADFKRANVCKDQPGNDIVNGGR
jgi:hypothetical protein